MTAVQGKRPKDALGLASGRRSAACLLVILLHQVLLTAFAQTARAQETLTEIGAGHDARFWELGVYYPFQYYVTNNALGRSTAYTAAGAGLIAHRPIGWGLGILALYQADLNAVSGATIFSGASLGLSFAVFGEDEIRSRSATFLLRRRPRSRGLVSFGIGSRNYDFRSLLSEDSVNNAKAQGKTLDVEGSGWAPFARMHFDTVVGASARLGAFLQFQSILPNSASNTRIQSFVLGLVYDFGRLSSEEGKN